jgi:hypothetical protein
MSWQVISTKDCRECVECTKQDIRDAEIVLHSIRYVLELSGWKIKEDKVWRVNDGELYNKMG